MSDPDIILTANAAKRVAWIAERQSKPAILRLAVAIVFSAPAAVAGYALVHGVTREAVPSEVWQQIFCIAGGIFVGSSALARLADHSIFDQDR